MRRSRAGSDVGGRIQTSRRSNVVKRIFIGYSGNVVPFPCRLHVVMVETLCSDSFVCMHEKASKKIYIHGPVSLRCFSCLCEYRDEGMCLRVCVGAWCVSVGVVYWS
jgi:hypothetical protein